RKVVGTFVAVLAVAVAGIFLMARRYGSEAKLFIRVGRESVGLDPTATTGQTSISMSDSRESEITSVVDLLASRGLRERVLDAVGVAAIVPSAGDEDDALARAQAIRRLDKWIE